MHGDASTRRTRAVAHTTLYRAVVAGKLPRPDTLTCTDCGGPAREYDHYLGYAPEHRLSVQPVCRGCHNKRAWDRGERLRPPPKSERTCIVCGEPVPKWRTTRCNRCRLYLATHGVERPLDTRKGDPRYRKH